MNRTHGDAPLLRGAAAAAAAVLAVAGVAACSESSGGDTAGAFETLSEELGSLDDRITELEKGRSGSEAGPPDDEAALFTDPSGHVGEEVTVTGDVSELYDTTGAGAAFRISGEVGEEIPVVATDPPPDLLDDDVVRVTGTVVQVDGATFEETFGISAAELLKNSEGFFVDADGEAAIKADSVEKVPSASED